MKREKTFSEMLSEMMSTPSENLTDVLAGVPFDLSRDSIDPTFSSVRALPKRPNYPFQRRREPPPRRSESRPKADVFLSSVGLSEIEQKAVRSFANWGEKLIKDDQLPLSSLKGAYRRLAKSFHPDLSEAHADPEKFRRLHDAYRTLIAAFEKKKAAEAASQKAA